MHARMTAVVDASADAAGDARVDATVDVGVDAAADAGPPCTPGPLTEHTVGGWTVAVDTATGAWSATPPGAQAPVLRSPPACAPGLAATRGDLGVRSAFGGFLFDYNPLEELLPVGAPEVEAGVDLALRFGLTDGTEAVVRFAPYGDGHLRIGLEAEATGGMLHFACAPEEGFFGLGSQVVGPDLRGRRYPLWTQEQGISKPANGQPFPVANIPEAAYAPLGIWHSSAGFSAVIGHDGFSALDLCAAQEDRWTLLSHRALPDFPPTACAPSPPSSAARPTPPPGPLGPGTTRWAARAPAPGRRPPCATTASPPRPSGARTGSAASRAGRGFRLSYAWEWDPAQYPDLPSDIEWLHARLRVSGLLQPLRARHHAHVGRGRGGRLSRERRRGRGPLVSIPAFRPAGLVDLTNPDGRAWLPAICARPVDLGIDGWMADFAEWLPIGPRWPTAAMAGLAHNPYPLQWQALNVEAMEAAHPDPPWGQNDWTFFSRSGWASINGGVTAPAFWAGDQNTDWDRDDGLPTIIPIGVHLGLSGVHHYGSDIGGYTSELNPHTTKELFFRWASAAAFHPLMRTHHGSDECGNWSFDRDAETLAHYRRWARIHTRLFPQFYFREDAFRGPLPTVRHPWLVFPDDPAFWRAPDQFFVQDRILVAPVVEAGATSRRVHVPEEGMWPLLGTEHLPEGPAAEPVLEVEAAPTEIPAFVRPGTVLTLLMEPLSTLYGVNPPGLNNRDDMPDLFTFALYPNRFGEIEPQVLTFTGPALFAVEGLVRAPDWSMAELDGQPLPPCGEPPCYDADRVRLDLPQNGNLLTVGIAKIFLPAGRYNIAYAGEAFGDDRYPTPLTDLDPDIPPPCEVP
jgi:alpha-glucosidase